MTFVVDGGWAEHEIVAARVATLPAPPLYKIDLTCKLKVPFADIMRMLQRVNREMRAVVRRSLRRERGAHGVAMILGRDEAVAEMPESFRSSRWRRARGIA